MRRNVWAWSAIAAAGLLAAGMAVSGCAKKAPPPDPIAAPATPETAREIREAFKKQDASAIVGLVIAALPDQNLVAVGDVPVGQIKNGQLVTFIDSNQAVIAVGNVVNTTADAVHVKYTPQGERARAPREGDLMVRVSS